MVRDDEGRAGARIEQLEAALLAHGEQAVIAQDAIEVDRRRHVAEPVLGEHDDVRAALFVERNQIRGDVIDLARCQPAAAGSPGPTRCRL